MLYSADNRAYIKIDRRRRSLLALLRSSLRNMSEGAKWYVVHTYSGYENKVAADIEKAAETRRMTDLIQAVSVPLEKVVELKDNKR